MKFEFSTFKTVASCSILMLTNFSVSGQTTFTINSETIKTITIDHNFLYPVEYREIDYYPYVEGKVQTDYYKSFLNDKKELKASYDEYISDSNNDSIKNSKRTKIIELLSLYVLNSKDNKLLDEANKLSKDLNLKYIIEDNSSSYAGWGVKPKKTLYIKDEKGKYASKAMIKEYLMSINNDRNFEDKISPSSDSKKYLQKLEEEKQLTDSDKYEIGLIKSENLAKRKAYLVLRDQEIKNIQTIFGNYKEISSTMLIANTTLGDRFIENELSDDVRKYLKYDGENRYMLIENTITGKFYVMPYDVYSNIIAINSDEVAIKKLASMGYNINDSNGYRFINTKHFKIQATDALKKRLEKEKDYLQKLDIWYEQRQAIRKQLILLLPKLKYYVQLYAVQRSRMSKADILAWSKLTKSAIALNDKEVDFLVNKLYGFTDKINATDKQKILDVGDYIYTSRGILGF